ncbi:tetratricopeptide repeat protein [Cytophagaceae bacterium DM2B3-1]|uniref:Tetratricopeptide repeat protein n=1 Tax=Xanthocytophaga flava TaxID=3048013 RepID=A0ABT7CTP2_9BACT|nr:tetratricopeptide repeat protein [Xanthocytophaga flavus]MDJ1497119.1 tetratricopeptide repeat protein [Xanthocytophaga flavus]
MKHFYLLFIFIYLSGYTQILSQDSLKQEFLHTKAHQYETFFETLDARLTQLPMKEALSIVRILQNAGNSDNPEKLQHYITQSLFRIHYQQKNYLLADSLLQKDLIHTKKYHLISEHAETLLNLGMVYNTLYKYSEATQYMQQAYHLFSSQNKKARAATALYELGNLCLKMPERDCEEYFQKALALGGDSLKRVYHISSLNTLGLIQSGNKRYSQSLSYYQKALDLAAATHDSAWMGIVRGNIGFVLLQTGREDEALAYLLEDMESGLQHNELLSAAAAAVSISKIYRDKKQPDLAKKYLLQGIELTQKVGFLPVLKPMYKELASIYEQEKQYTEAIKYLHLQIQLNDSLAKKRREIDVIKMQSSFDLQKKENEVKNLTEENARQKHLTVIVITGLTLCLLLVILTLRIRQKIKINQLLIRQKTDLENEVTNRTHTLLEYNHQLKEFSFMTAHNLRRPVAMILGLGQVLRLPDNKPDEERLYIEKLIDTTNELDLVLKQMNGLLEKKQDSVIDN